MIVITAKRFTGPGKIQLKNAFNPTVACSIMPPQTQARCTIEEAEGAQS